MSIFIGNEITYLLPGEIIVTTSQLKISTVLGSCVSVCMFDKEHSIAGMNHYLFPYNTNNDNKIFKYGDTSLKYMLNKMIGLGAGKEKIVARVYGGSSMFVNTGPGFNIGSQNIEVAKSFIRENGIGIDLIETGGKIGRNIIFDTSAGIVSLKMITPSNT